MKSKMQMLTQFKQLELYITIYAKWCDKLRSLEEKNEYSLYYM